MSDDRKSSILAILLGARAFPNAPKLAASRAFLNSAIDMEDYLSDQNGLGLLPQNVLSLFDDPRSPSDQLIEVAKFLEHRTKDLEKQGFSAEDLFVYYVGHGLFTRGDGAYCLAIRSTNEIDEGATSIRAGQLAGIIMRNAAFMRRYLILDCCFAASIHKEFQSGALSAVKVQIERDLPPKLGTALLCSSSAREVSLAPQGLSHTMFSSALLQSLRTGHRSYGARFSFSQLGDLINGSLRASYPDSYVRPEVHSPDQREGDIARNPVFPNPAFRDTVGSRTEGSTTVSTSKSVKPREQFETPNINMPREEKFRNKESSSTGRHALAGLLEKRRPLNWLVGALAVTLFVGVVYWAVRKPSTAPSLTGSSHDPVTPASKTNHKSDGQIDPSGISSNNPPTPQKIDTAKSDSLNVDSSHKKRIGNSGAPSPSLLVNGPLSFEAPTSRPQNPNETSKTDGNETSAYPQADASARLLLPRNLLTKTSGTWTVLQTGTRGWLLSIAFATAQEGSAVGWYGAMVHTDDGGAHWTEQDFNSNGNLVSVAFATAKVGLSVGAGGVILQTEDAGRTWSRQTSGTGENLGSIAFVSPQSAFVVGGHGTVLHTEDGGRSWTRQDAGTDVGLSSVVFATQLSGWAVGNDGVVLHTEDGGRNWVRQNTGVGELLHSVSFANTKFGWIVGQNGVILHTEDGGQSWIRQSWGSTKELHAIAFASPQSGFAVGESGTIIHTEDAGKTWTNQPSNTGTELFGALITPQARWATGRDGILLRWQ